MSKNTLFGNRWIKVEGQLIGKGGQGLIYFVKDSSKPDSDKLYVLKKMKSGKINNRYPRFKQEIETVQMIKEGIKRFIFFQALNCNSCGHIQFFKIDQSKL